MVRATFVPCRRSGQWSVVSGQRSEGGRLYQCLIVWGKYAITSDTFMFPRASRLKHLEGQEFLCKGHPGLVHNTDHVKVEWPCQSVDAWSQWPVVGGQWSVGMGDGSLGN